MVMTFFWLGMGGCDHFLAGCRWVGVSVTFFGLVWVGVGECDLFLAGCGWVWMSVAFLWLGVGGYA